MAVPNKIRYGSSRSDSCDRRRYRGARGFLGTARGLGAPPAELGRPARADHVPADRRIAAGDPRGHGGRRGRPGVRWALPARRRPPASELGPARRPWPVERSRHPARRRQGRPIVRGSNRMSLHSPARIVACGVGLHRRHGKPPASAFLLATILAGSVRRLILLEPLRSQPSRSRHMSVTAGRDSTAFDCLRPAASKSYTSTSFAPAFIISTPLSGSIVPSAT